MIQVLQVLLGIVGFAGLVTWICTTRGGEYPLRVVLTLAVLGVLVFVDGFTLAVREEYRTRYGRVMSGVVDSLRSDNSVRDRGQGRTHASDLGLYAGLWQTLLTRSLDVWIVEYSYPCSGATGRCSGQDLVARDLWERLEVGQSVKVRQSIDETGTARLDENPQRGLALIKTALACVLLGAAGLMSGHLTLFRRHKYIEVDAIVTSVDRVQYGDEMRWKVHFAYFDNQGNAQDSVDEVNDPSWKVGDDCRAVYLPKVPDAATLRPRLGSDRDLTPV